MIDSKLLTFISLAKFKSYTRTAESLNLTQPAVTQHIKQLEAYYEVKLFSKNGRYISLTEEGELLLSYAKEFKSNSLLLERKLKNRSSVVKRYNIGATLTIGEFVLPHLLGYYKKLHKNTDVIMQVHNSDEVFKRTSSGELDLGIVEGPFDKSRFNYTKMRDDELVLVVSPNDDLANNTGVEMTDILKSGKLILREKGSGTRQIFENKLMQLGYVPSDSKIYMEIGSIGAIKSLVKANLGYTVISKEAVKSDVDNGTLVIIPIYGVRIIREFNFIYLDRSPVEFIKDFIMFLSTWNQQLNMADKGILPCMNSNEG